MSERISCETGIRDYEQLYRLLVDQLRDVAVFLMDPSGCITTWNQGVQNVLGYTDEEFIGKPTDIIFTPEDLARNAHLRELELAAQHGHAADKRWHMRKDGSRFYCDGVLAAMKDEHGQVLGFTKVMRDATAQKRAEDQAQELMHALEQAQILVRDVDGCIRLWSAGAERLYGYTKEEAMGRISHELLQTEFSQPLADINAELFEKGSWHGQLRHRHKDGRHVVVKSDWTIHHEGGRSRVVESNSDISESQRINALLHASEERFRRAFAHAPVGMAVKTPEGQLLHVNQAYCDILGYPAEELLDRNALDFVYPEDRKEKAELTSQLIAGAIPDFVLETRYVRRNGQTVWVQAADAVLREEEGRPTQIIAIVLDIQERKNAEAILRRSNEDLTRFAHVVAHDLQAPLRSVRSYTQFLAKRYKGKLDTTGDEFVQFILDGADGMQELIRALLRYAAVGSEETERKPVRVEGVIDTVLVALQPAIEETDAIITCQDLSTVQADRVQLTQLFQNLIGNALKYRKPDERPHIHISSREEPGECLFTIADNGMGIDPEHHTRIFEPLKRLHGREIAGTGIGLAVCQKIVERHGGRIWVESELDNGARFCFTLPSN